MNARNRAFLKRHELLHTVLSYGTRHNARSITPHPHAETHVVVVAVACWVIAAVLVYAALVVTP